MRLYRSLYLSGALLSLMLAGYSVQSTAAPLSNISDKQIQRELTGTWFFTWPKGRHLTTTNVIKPDGSYMSKVSGFANGKTIRTEGTFIITNGVALATVTNENGTTLHTPKTMKWHIIRLNSHELIWSNNGVVEPAFHKAGG